MKDDAKEIEEFERSIGKGYDCYHAISKNGHKGVTLMIKKNLFDPTS